jgi:hypothetical protein
MNVVYNLLKGVLGIILGFVALHIAYLVLSIFFNGVVYPFIDSLNTNF